MTTVRVVATFIFALFVASYVSARADPMVDSLIADLIADLNAYTREGRIPNDYDWIENHFSDAAWLRINKGLISNLMYYSRQRFLAKNNSIHSINLGEPYDPSAINIYVIRPDRDVLGILKRVHATGNAVSFPPQNLIIIDGTMLDKLMETPVALDLSLSNSSRSDFVIFKLTDCPPGSPGAQEGAKCISTTPRAPLTPAEIEVHKQTEYRSTALTTFIVLLHEIGHIYHKHAFSLFSSFHPTDKTNNIEIEADSFALSVFEEMAEASPTIKDSLNTLLSMGIEMELSYHLQTDNGHTFLDFFDSKYPLVFKYYQFDVHPPLAYRLLVTQAVLTDAIGIASQYNHYKMLLERATWSKELFR